MPDLSHPTSWAFFFLNHLHIIFPKRHYTSLDIYSYTPFEIWPIPITAYKNILTFARNLINGIRLKYHTYYILSLALQTALNMLTYYPCVQLNILLTWGTSAVYTRESRAINFCLECWPVAPVLIASRDISAQWAHDFSWYSVGDITN